MGDDLTRWYPITLPSPQRGEIETKKRPAISHEAFPQPQTQKNPAAISYGVFLISVKEGLFSIQSCGPGGDLLSRALRQSTIGAKSLNFRVRNGIGWGALAIATRSTRLNGAYLVPTSDPSRLQKQHLRMRL